MREPFSQEKPSETKNPVPYMLKDSTTYKRRRFDPGYTVDTHAWI